MRPWSRAALAGLLLAAAAPASAASYDPEVALLVYTVQKQSVALVRDELRRQAEFLELGAMTVLLAERGDKIAARVGEKLDPEQDVVESFHEQIARFDPEAERETGRLIAEVRRYHDLVPGPPLQRVRPPEDAPAPEIVAVDGTGPDVAAGLSGRPALDEPVAYAERRFGTTGPFLRRRLWDVDFYLGALDDLVSHYRKLGYRRFYRLRAPYVSYGKEAYVLPPEPGLRPRLVYCAFQGRDLFLHTRAQWAVLQAEQAEGPRVRTLSCASCAWTLPGVKAMNELLATVPFQAENVIAGSRYLFEEEWKDRLLGVYENDYWRLAYYRTDPTISVLVEARRTDFGEILAAALTPLVRKGARRVFYSGPAAELARGGAGRLALPDEFLLPDGSTIAFRNALLGKRRGDRLAGLPSPLFATREWLDARRRAGVAAFDSELARLGEAALAWAKLPGPPVEVGLGATLGPIAGLHPEEDRSLYTLTYANQLGREDAKQRFHALVVGMIGSPAR